MKKTARLGRSRLWRYRGKHYIEAPEESSMNCNGCAIYAKSIGQCQDILRANCYNRRIIYKEADPMHAALVEAKMLNKVKETENGK